MAVPKAEVVISGISGRFPECDSVAELRKKLFAGEDLVSCDRRQQDLGSWGAPKYVAMLKNLDEFDAEFFGMNPAQVESVDPQARIVLETVYEAIVDSGQNPQKLRGSRTGVFVGISFSDSEQFWAHKFEEENCGRYLLGNSDALVANRISYFFDFKGPSVALDTGCSSSLYAVEAAVDSIAAGKCDAAVVAATNISLNPLLSAALCKAGALNHDGRCKVFDDSADGYTRAEAVVAILLQRKEGARRLYAEVVGARVNSDGYKENSIMFPSSQMQSALMSEAYREAGVDPALVGYIEAHGTATKVGDPQELLAIGEVFCNNRKFPLLVGSVKSSMGHSEAASGLCSIVKVILAFETRQIPPNLHYKEPNRQVPQLLDGQIKVVTETTPLPGDLVAINSFGFGGSNAHLILRRPASRRSPAADGCQKVPVLVGVSGRSERSVDVLLDAVEREDFDQDLISLLHGVHEADIPRHPYRGYITRTVFGRVNKVVQTRRQVWFVFSGLGSQFSGMGAELMRIPVFKDTVDRCAQAVKEFDIDLHDVVCSSDFDFAEADFSTTFVAIVAVQMGLFEILRSTGVRFNRIVGHSLGEHSAAYADGCLTLEQAVLSAYHRGKVTDDLRCQGGSMAVVGMSAAEVEALSPEGVVVACDNGEHQVTVGGAAPGVRQLLEAARQAGAAACELATRGAAFHGPLTRPAAHQLLQRLQQVIPDARARTERWLSSSVSREDWGTPLGRTCSAEYLTHNYSSPVLFRQACSGVPLDAVVVEVSPHALMLPAMRPSLGPDAVLLPLQAKNCDPLPALLSALGRLFVSGVPVRMSALFPSPQLPVKTGTAMLSPLVVWDHTCRWFVPSFSNKANSRDVFAVDVNSPKYEWCRGHKIDGRILFPATGYLVIVWESLAARRGVSQENLAVTFSDVVFHHATVLNDRGGATELKVDVLDSGAFEVRVGDVVSASGKVTVSEGAHKEFTELPPCSAADGGLILNSADVNTILRLRGYHYTGQFAGVLQVKEGVGGTVRRNENWVPLLDTILQVVLLQQLSDTSSLYLPTKFRKVIIDPSKFKDAPERLEVRTCPQLRLAECCGVQVHDVTATRAARRRDDLQPRVDGLRFVPHRGHAAADLRQALSVCLQLVLEDLRAPGVLRVAEIQGPGRPPVLPLVTEILAVEPLVTARLTFVADGEVAGATRGVLQAAGVDVSRRAPGDDDVVIVHQDDPRPRLYAVLPGGFLVALRGRGDTAAVDLEGASLVAAFRLPCDSGASLFRKHVEHPCKKILFNMKTDGIFQWVDDLKGVLRNSEDSDVLIVAEEDSCTGIVGFVNCLRREPGVPFIRYVAVMDAAAPRFCPDSPPYRDQLALGLASNVLKDGVWGSYRFLSPPEDEDVLRLETTEHARVDIARPGDLSSLRWIQTTDPRHSDDKGTLIHVCYSALNFRDVITANGRLPEDCVLGMEVSGLCEKGERVMGIVTEGGLSTSVRSSFVWEVPRQWSLREAATIPVVYATAYYSLVVRGQMRLGQSVLIHSGSGGVGQAAIAISLHMSCTVFTTVGTEEKRAFLKNRFPQLDDRNIGNSRNESFYSMVMLWTNGRGVDLVLNSLAEEKLQASVRCLTDNGHFLEIGKFDMYTDNSIGLRAFLKNISFHGINLIKIMSDDQHACDQLRSLLAEGIRTGVVKPLPSTVFEWDQVENAFRYMAAGSHIGKVLIHVTSKDKPMSVLAQPKLCFNPNEFIIVTGGLGGLGLELCEMLVSRGARNLVLVSRKPGAASGHGQLRMRRWKDAGVGVALVTPGDAPRVTRTCAGPVVAILHLAAVLSDGLFERQTAEDFREVWRPKVGLLRRLDETSRQHCPHLKFFVAFSSASAGFGNPGQTNYALANSSMERLVEKRVADGYPGLAVQWGPIADVGLAADVAGALESSGVAHQSVPSFLETLERLLMSGGQGVFSSVVVSKQPRGTAQRQEHLLQTLSKILSVADVRNLPAETTMVELGVDSLMQVELRTGLERHGGVCVSPAEMRTLTVGQMLRLVGRPGKKHPPEATPELDDARRYVSLLQFAYSPAAASCLSLPRDTLLHLAGGHENSRTLFFVHPMDGSADSLREIASRIDCNVACFQFSREVPRGSLPRLAAFYLQKVRALQPEGPYLLGGYSMGVIVVIEMALQLQRDGSLAHVLSLDGLPAMERLRQPHVLGHIEARYLLNAVLARCPGVDASSLERDLSCVDSWSGRLELCLSALGSKVSPEEAGQLEEALEAFHWRLKACADHERRGGAVISGHVLVVVAKEGLIQAEDSPQASFSKVSTGRVDTVRVDGGHVSFICGELRTAVVAGHINAWLSALQ